jgi:hypothetical protein
MEKALNLNITYGFELVHNSLYLTDNFKEWHAFNNVSMEDIPEIINPFMYKGLPPASVICMQMQEGDFLSISIPADNIFLATRKISQNRLKNLSINYNINFFYLPSLRRT